MPEENISWPTDPSVIGTHVQRLDGPDKVTGRAKYTFDITRPGMLYARIVRSPYPHARVVSVDISPAVKMPPLARNQVDEQAVQLINEWINQLPVKSSE